jgi:hypothetical protein
VSISSWSHSQQPPSPDKMSLRSGGGGSKEAPLPRGSPVLHGGGRASPFAEVSYESDDDRAHERMQGPQPPLQELEKHQEIGFGSDRDGQGSVVSSVDQNRYSDQQQQEQQEEAMEPPPLATSEDDDNIDVDDAQSPEGRDQQEPEQEQQGRSSSARKRKAKKQPQPHPMQRLLPKYRAVYSTQPYEPRQLAVKRGDILYAIPDLDGEPPNEPGWTYVMSERSIEVRE